MEINLFGKTLGCLFQLLHLCLGHLGPYYSGNYWSVQVRVMKIQWCFKVVILLYYYYYYFFKIWVAKAFSLKFRIVRNCLLQDYFNFFERKMSRLAIFDIEMAIFLRISFKTKLIRFKPFINGY